MSKVRVNQFDQWEKYKITGDLLEVISDLKNREEVFDFLFRLLTRSEVLMLARRLQIATMLIDGKQYELIRKQLKVSHRTISDVERWLTESQPRGQMIRKKIETMREKTKAAKTKRAKGKLVDIFPEDRMLKDMFLD